MTDNYVDMARLPVVGAIVSLADILYDRPLILIGIILSIVAIVIFSVIFGRKAGMAAAIVFYLVWLVIVTVGYFH